MLNELDTINKSCASSQPCDSSSTITPGFYENIVRNSDVESHPNGPFSHPTRLFLSETDVTYSEDFDYHRNAFKQARPSSTPGPLRSSLTNVSEKSQVNEFVLDDSSWSTNQPSSFPAQESRIAKPPTNPSFIIKDCYDQKLLDDQKGHEFPAESEKVPLNSSSIGVDDPLFQTEQRIPKLSSPNIISSEISFNDLSVRVDDETIKTGLKRPRSAVTNRNNWFDSDDSLSRPLSAPKRLTEDSQLTCISNLTSILTSGTNTPTPTTLVTVNTNQTNNNNNSCDAPRPALEALVASTSPFLFSPHEFPVDSNSQEEKQFTDFPATDPDLQTVPSTNNSNFSLDFVSSSVDIASNKTESDFLNTNVNSVSSSKSLTSLDLSDPNIKDPDSHKSSFSDLGLPSDGPMDQIPNPTVQLNDYVEAMRTYAAELCPVDCVILLERCRPFNCDTQFMKYFRDQYLSPILSNLNGGPPLNADFGRDAYTSLYSLHGYCWQKPLKTTTLVSDTPIIYKILKHTETMQHEARHANGHLGPNESTPGYDLLQAAVHEFDTIDRARRGLCRHVQRHLILLAMSPIDLSKLHNPELGCNNNLGTNGSDSPHSKVLSPLINLRERGVALSVFSPIRNHNLLQLYEMVNCKPAPSFYDRLWQTVALSEKLVQSDTPERRVIGPIATAFHAQAEIQVSERKQQQQQQQQQSLKHTIPNGHSNFNSEISQASPQSIPSVPEQSPHSRMISQDDLFRGHDNQIPQSAYGNSINMVTDPAAARSNTNRPNLPPQFTGRAISPISASQRGLRNSTPMANQPNPNLLGYSNRPAGTTRVNMDNMRSIDSATHPASSNSLSTGHSGPNSVDQAPGSAYGSDSVATPQTVYSSQGGTMSPQQTSTCPPSLSQLHSPVPSNNLVGGQYTAQSTPPCLHASYPSYHSNSGQLNPYAQPMTYENQHNPMTIRAGMSGPPSSPNSAQAPFRPPSNAASPSIQFNPATSMSMGLSSPCNTRNNANRQYSPQLAQNQQGSPQQRINTAQATCKQMMALQSGRGSQFSSNPESLTPQSRANSPNNSIHPSNPMISSSPLNSSQYNPTSANVTPVAVAASTSGPTSGSYLSKELSRTSSHPSHNTPSPLGSTHSSIESNGPGHPNTMQSQPNTSSTVQSRRQQQQPSQQMYAMPVLWEGEVIWNDPTGTTSSTPSNNTFTRLGMRLLLEPMGSRDISQINMQLWDHNAQLNIIHVYQNSPIVQCLLSQFSSAQVMANLVVEIPSEEATALANSLSVRVNQHSLSLGILSPTSTIPSPLQPGTVGFICLIYKRNPGRIYGLVPYDSEKFRRDIPILQYNKSTVHPNAEIISGPFQRTNPASGGTSVSSNPGAAMVQQFGPPESQINMRSCPTNSAYMNAQRAQASMDPVPNNTGTTNQSGSVTYQYQSQNPHPMQSYMTPQQQQQQQQQSHLTNVMQTSSTGTAKGQMNAVPTFPTHSNHPLGQRATPSPHLQHEMVPGGMPLPQHHPQQHSDSYSQSQWTSSRCDPIGHPSQHLPGSNSMSQQQPFRGMQVSQQSQQQQQQQASHLPQQSVSQRSGSAMYSAPNPYSTVQTQSRLNGDRMGVPNTTVMQCSSISESGGLIDQPNHHNSPQNDPMLQGQQIPQRFLSNNTRFQSSHPPNAVSNTYQRTGGVAPGVGGGGGGQLSNPNPSYAPSQQQFVQRQHYIGHPSQTHVQANPSVGPDYSSGANCYPNRPNVVPSGAAANPSGHRFMTGSPNLGNLGPQSSNQPQQMTKHQHLSMLAASENQAPIPVNPGVHSRSTGPNPNCAGIPLENLSGQYPMATQEVSHMIRAPMPNSLRPQQSYDNLGPGGPAGFF